MVEFVQSARYIHISNIGSNFNTPLIHEERFYVPPDIVTEYLMRSSFIFSRAWHFFAERVGLLDLTLI